MDKLGRGDWGDQEILDALTGRSGAREIKFRADILQDGAKAREVQLAPGGSVTLDTDNDIIRSARFVLYGPVDELKEEIKPYMLLRMGDAEMASPVAIGAWDQWDAQGNTWDAWAEKNLSFDAAGRFVFDGVKLVPQYAEFGLGVFVPSTPARSSEGGLNTWSIEAYDRTVILAEDGLDEPLYIAAGTRYLDAVLSILAGVGATNVMVSDYAPTTLQADREFDVGTTKLEVVNTLLSEINYAPVYCDIEGRYVLEVYQEPSPAAPDYTYAADDMSVIGRDTQTETDYYGMPNVFIAVCSNPDLDEDYRSVYVNDNPVSAFSTVRRGRRIVSEIYRPEQIASQADLDAYVKRQAFERTLSASETVTFATALMPIHGRGDDLEIKHPDIAGVYREVRWTLPLEAGGEMEHTAKRTVIL